jgi:hypothetical protein
VYARRPSTTHCDELLVTALARTVTLFCVWLSAYVALHGSSREKIEFQIIYEVADELIFSIPARGRERNVGQAT